MTRVPTAELDEVHAAVRALTDRVGELVAARRRAVRTLEDWTGAHRDAYDRQLPTSQADLDDLVDEARAAEEAARAEVAAIVVDAYVHAGGP